MGNTVLTGGDTDEMADILTKLADLHQQATKERSHYYTGKLIREAIAEIVSLRAQIKMLDKQLKQEKYHGKQGKDTSNKIQEG